MARTPLAWYGGKGNMLGVLLPLIPQGGEPYCEPYAGGAATFWMRRRATRVCLDKSKGAVAFGAAARGVDCGIITGNE